MKNVIYNIVIYAIEIFKIKDVIYVHLDQYYIHIKMMIINMKKNVYFKMQVHKIVDKHIIIKNLNVKNVN